MTIEISQDQLRELNSIKSMFLSPDPESKSLGYELLKTNSLIEKNKELYYQCNNGKWVPITWIFSKTDQLKASSDGDLRWMLIVTPMLFCLIDGISDRFRAHVNFKFK